MKLYFVRHGQSVANAERWVAGTIDTPLTDKGREQAAEAAQQVKELSIELNAIVSSDLVRATETAQIISQVLGVDALKVVPEFRERSTGAMSGQYLKDINYQDNPFNYFTELEKAGGEGIAALDLRAKRCMEVLQTLEAPLLAVGHSGFMRHLRLRYDPSCESAKTLLDLPRLENGVLYEFELIDGLVTA